MNVRIKTKLGVTPCPVFAAYSLAHGLFCFSFHIQGRPRLPPPDPCGAPREHRPWEPRRLLTNAHGLSLALCLLRPQTRADPSPLVVSRGPRLVWRPQRGIWKILVPGLVFRRAADPIG